MSAHPLLASRCCAQGSCSTPQISAAAEWTAPVAISNHAPTPRYDTGRTVAAWRALTASAAYPYARDCHASLRAMFGSQLWQARMEQGGFNSYVSLGGGGAPEKDRSLLAAIGKARHHQPQPCLIILDRDAAMLDMTRQALPAGAHRLANVQLVDDDFMNLPGALEPFSGSTMWLLSGATFGNQPEDGFASSISAAARPGDWLALGVDLRDQRDPSRQRDLLLAAYGSPEARAFYSLAAGSDLKEAAASLNVDVVESCRDGLSSVPGSLSLIAHWDGRPPMRSNRYDANFLRHWWVLRGWRQVAIIKAPAGGTYCQLLLERVGG